MKATTKINQPLPKKLKDWRQRAKLSQVQAAAQLGAPVRTYEKWEGGFQTPRGLALAALLERIKQ